MNNDPIPEWFLEKAGAPLAVLATLTEEQRRAVRFALKLWVQVATHHEYEPLRDWKNFGPEVDHSALLDRILHGKSPLLERPRTEHSYPVYPD